MAPGVYFRLQLIGFFEGVDSERGIAWRVADSLSLRGFLGYGLDQSTPDHVTLSRTRRLLDDETHQAVFSWVLERLAAAGLLKGKTIGVDATTLEANAAMRSIVRRATGESYREYLARLAAADGEATDAASLQRKDRRRKKKASNEDWVNPHEPEAEITKMKDGRTGLAFKAEKAVDLETGAIVATTVHGGATGDTTSIQETVPAAGEAVAEQLAKSRQVNNAGIEDLVADKGYHSGATLAKLAEWGLRSYVSEPKRGRRNWRGKAAEQAATYANRRRVTGERGKALMRQRGEKLRPKRRFGRRFSSCWRRWADLCGRVTLGKTKSDNTTRRDLPVAAVRLRAVVHEKPRFRHSLLGGDRKPACDKRNDHYPKSVENGNGTQNHQDRC